MNVIWGIFLRGIVLVVLVLFLCGMGLYALFAYLFEWVCNQVEIELKRQQAAIDAKSK